MRIRICYLDFFLLKKNRVYTKMALAVPTRPYTDSHEAGLCCYIVIYIQNLLRPLQLFYFNLWHICWFSLVEHSSTRTKPPLFGTAELNSIASGAVKSCESGAVPPSWITQLIWDCRQIGMMGIWNMSWRQIFSSTIETNHHYDN
jgi:hypothetical protein